MTKSDAIKDNLTIVIPALNEIDRIPGLITDIVRQAGSRGIHVIVADGGSTDGTREEVIRMADIFKHEIRLELIEGGTVSQGRNRGLELVETLYVLFLDADVNLPDGYTLQSVVKALKRNWLVTARLRSRSGFPSNFVYRTFNAVMRFIGLWRPFATGAFFATRSCLIRRKGGFREDVVHSEDWLLSGLYPAERFAYLRKPTVAVIDDRRFKRMGYLGMALCMFRSLRYGESYMVKDNGYWSDSRFSRNSK
jgi:glycosyltransferase involved in cell wall biosynthesis